MWCLYTLGRHPEIAERVRQQVISVTADENFKMNELEKTVPLLNGTIKESLRLYPTAPQLNRIITKDAEFYGYFIPERVRASEVKFFLYVFLLLSDFGFLAAPVKGYM